ncbi:hypothetical protein [Ascidiimonas aurantiaca]|uniref:hypothetical protein n=1 Tax=Ascidiimonas aurantiaca TaxID=1685432 RepID=UPI0030EBF545
MKKKNLKKLSLNKKRISQFSVSISLGGIRRTVGEFSCVQGGTCLPTQMITICFTTCARPDPSGCNAIP